MKTDDEIQLEGFDAWWWKLFAACESCLTRDVLRNQKKSLREEWLKVRPMIDSKDYDRDDRHRVIKKEGQG